MNKVYLGHSIAALRTKKGLTQDQLSDMASLSYSTISKLERNEIKNPSFYSIVAIAQALDVPIERFLASQQQVNANTGIKFVYADMNGVMVRFFQRAFVSLARETGAKAELIETTFWHYNDQVNRGKMTIDEFNAAMTQRLHAKRTIDWKQHYLNAVEPITPMHECLAQIKKQGMKIGLLTNTMPGFVKSLEESGQMPKLEYDAVIDSSEVEAIKPEDKIYTIAQKRAGVSSDSILFIDDSRANLVAAERFGWHVLWFDDYRPNESVKRVLQAIESH